MSQMNFEKKFGQSAIFVTSTLMEQGGVPPSSSPAALLKEAIHVISCGYEDKTDWGQEVILTILFNVPPDFFYEFQVLAEMVDVVVYN